MGGRGFGFSQIEEWIGHCGLAWVNAGVAKVHDQPGGHRGRLKRAAACCLHLRLCRHTARLEGLRSAIAPTLLMLLVLIAQLLSSSLFELTHQCSVILLYFLFLEFEQSSAIVDGSSTVLVSAAPVSASVGDRRSLTLTQ